VTQILNLLKLDLGIQETVVRLGDQLPSSNLTEKKLRALSGLSVRQQRKRLRILLPNR
jgi:hypothetical protein